MSDFTFLFLYTMQNMVDLGQKDGLVVKSPWLLLQRTWVGFPAPTQVAYNCLELQFGGSDTLFWPSQTL